jgi:hypothetical protein
VRGTVTSSGEMTAAVSAAAGMAGLRMNRGHDGRVGLRLRLGLEHVALGVGGRVELDQLREGVPVRDVVLPLDRS